MLDGDENRALASHVLITLPRLLNDHFHSTAFATQPRQVRRQAVHILCGLLLLLKCFYMFISLLSFYLALVLLSRCVVTSLFVYSFIFSFPPSQLITKSEEVELLLQRVLPAGQLLYLTGSIVRAARRDVDALLTAAKS